MPELITSRLKIRCVVASDLESCQRTLAAGSAQTARDIAQTQRWLEWSICNYQQLDELSQPPYGDRAITLRESGELIGLAGFVPLLAPFGQLPSRGGVQDCRFSAEIGLFWSLAALRRGQGFATEAAAAFVNFGFESLQLQRLVAGTTHDNPASVAVMRRLGMRIESNPFTTPAWFQVVGILDWDAWTAPC